MQLKKFTHSCLKTRMLPRNGRMICSNYAEKGWHLLVTDWLMQLLLFINDTVTLLYSSSLFVHYHKLTMMG